MLTLKGKLEAIIYAAEEPVSIDQLIALLREAGMLESLLASADGENPDRAATEKDPKVEKAEIKSKLRALLEEMMASYGGEDRGIEMRQVAGGYRFSTKPEHHDVVRAFAKSLKPPVRLS